MIILKPKDRTSLLKAENGIVKVSRITITWTTVQPFSARSGSPTISSSATNTVHSMVCTTNAEVLKLKEVDIPSHGFMYIQSPSGSYEMNYVAFKEYYRVVPQGELTEALYGV